MSDKDSPNKGDLHLQKFKRWDQVPAHLKTRTQLDRDGLKLQANARPTARIEYGSGRYYRSYALFEVKDAIPKRKPTPAQLAALEKARLAKLTCRGCGKVVAAQWELEAGEWTKEGYCGDCEVKAEREFHAQSRREEVEWARALLGRDDWLVLDTETTDLNGYLLEIGIVHPDGTVAFESLVRPPAGSESQGDDSEDGEEWEEEEESEPSPSPSSSGPLDAFPATRIHGLRPSDVAAAPTFAEIEPQLRALLHGKTVVIYNAAFDCGMIEGELLRIHAPARPQSHRYWWLDGKRMEAPPEVQAEWDAYEAAEEQAEATVAAWMDAVTWDCAMLSYARFYGDWSERHRSYTWQRLNGGHRAVGDCRAVLDLIRLMAALEASATSQDEEEAAGDEEDSGGLKC